MPPLLQPVPLALMGPKALLVLPAPVLMGPKVPLALLILPAPVLRRPLALKVPLVGARLESRVD